MAEEDEKTLISIEDGILAISLSAEKHRINTEFLRGETGHVKRSRLTWANILPVFERELPNHPMSRSTYEAVWEGVSDGAGSLKQAYDAVLSNWRAVWWSHFRAELIDELEKDFGSHRFTGQRLREHLTKWPNLRRQKRIVKRALEQLSPIKSHPLIKEALENLAELKGTVEDARIVLAGVTAIRHYSDDGTIASLLTNWVGNRSWGKLMASLWADTPESRGTPQNIVKIAYLLRQLPLMTGPSLDGFELADMSGASRAAWRRSLRDAIGDNRKLRAAVTEALLWFGSNREDLFSQYAALEINGPDPRAAIEAYLSHPSRMVTLRARSALEILDKAADPIEALLTQDAPRSDVEVTAPASRTWLGDPRLEHMLRTAFAKAADSMAAEVLKTASSGEENLVGKLFERLRGVCEQVTQDAAVLARETDRGERLAVSLSHRVIGKSEEGKEGLVKGRRFSTDVTLIVRARKGAAPPFSQRATFIQAKRMRRGDNAEGIHYAVDMGQMGDIAAQTSSSFLLAVGPEVLGVTMPVVPAQLMVDRFGVEVKERHLHPNMVSRLGRSLATWLVDDVIGLWTGDPRIDAVSKASFGAGDCDTIIVEVEVAMVPTDSEREKA